MRYSTEGPLAVLWEAPHDAAGIARLAGSAEGSFPVPRQNPASVLWIEVGGGAACSALRRPRCLWELQAASLQLTSARIGNYRPLKRLLPFCRFWRVSPLGVRALRFPGEGDLL